MADPTRLELATSAVTGQRSNQLSYESTWLIITHFGDKIKSYIDGVLWPKSIGGAGGGGRIFSSGIGI